MLKPLTCSSHQKSKPRSQVWVELAVFINWSHSYYDHQPTQFFLCHVKLLALRAVYTAHSAQVVLNTPFWKLAVPWYVPSELHKSWQETSRAKQFLNAWNSLNGLQNFYFQRINLYISNLTFISFFSLYKHFSNFLVFQLISSNHFVSIQARCITFSSEAV